MSNTINVNGMTSYYGSFIKSVTSQTSVDKGSKVNSGTVTGEKDSLISTLSSKMETADAVEGTITVSTKDMTMEEYKQYISDQISKFRIDPSRSGDQYSINISNAGFEAMKNDSEYENWVLDYIRRDMAVAAPGWYTAMGGPSAYCILNFGATKEERTGEMFSAGYMNGKGKKELEEKWLQEAAEKRQAYTDFLNGDKVFKTNNISEFSHFLQMPSDPKVAGILSAYEAGTFVDGGY